MLLVLLLHCLFPYYSALIMSSVSTYQNTGGGDRGSTDRLLTYNYLTWLSISEKTINILCHAPRLMCLQWRGLTQFIQRQGTGGAGDR